MMMDKGKETQLWAAMAKLTRIDNERELFEELKISLGVIYNNLDLVFFKIHFKRNDNLAAENFSRDKTNIILVSDYFDPSMQARLLSEDSCLSSCYSQKKTVKCTAKDSNHLVYVFPLCYEKEVLFLLSVALSDKEAEYSSSLFNFFKIFMNYFKVICSNERDFLTGMYNRRAFNRVINNLEIHPEKTNSEKTDYLLIIDIDFFKSINDNYGHMIGDEVLILFSRILRENIRTTDVAFRTGGEEFIIITSELSAEGMERKCERLRKIIEQTKFPQVHTLTISGGFSRLEYPLDTFHVLKKADAALYYAKDHGRNQIFSYESLVENKMILPVTQLAEIIDVW